jgi:hypothetical protein
VARTSPAAAVLPPSCTKLPSATPSRTSDRPVASTSPPLLTQTYVVSDYYVFFVLLSYSVVNDWMLTPPKIFPLPSLAVRGEAILIALPPEFIVLVV